MHKDSLRDFETVIDIAKRVKKLGGRALLVGGSVRDRLLGLSPKDFDLEVYGVGMEHLSAALAEAYVLDMVGASFGVLKIHHHEIDVALPRRETRLGKGHRDFATDFDPAITIEEAASRRDFTINAIYQDPLTGEVIDPVGGAADLKSGVLRHVSKHFIEDPLRVLRGMQFVARFNLDPVDETIAPCRDMVQNTLPRERLFEEWSKLILKGVAISKGLSFLKKTGWVRYYPELKRLIGYRQAPQWHPEGDVWNHTCHALDAFAAVRDGKDSRCEFIGDFKSWTRHDNLIVGFATLCHDLGKPLSSYFDRKIGRIRSIGHDEKGVAPTLSFLRRLTNEERILKEVAPLVRLHMRVYALWEGNAGDAAIRRLSAQVGRIDRLLRVAAADDSARPPLPLNAEPLIWMKRTAERLDVEKSAPEMIVKGRDIVELGYKPSPQFGIWLRKCYDAQLDGEFSDHEHGISYLKEKVIHKSKLGG